MNKEDLYQQLKTLVATSYLPHVDFRVHVSNLEENYLKLLSQLDNEERPANWTKTIEKVEKNIAIITETLDLYYDGLYSGAYQKIKLYLDNLRKVKMIPNKVPYYRMRVVQTGTRPTHEGMFHIPFNKRTIVNTERYSTPGYPCLYLAQSSYTCWKEMGEPDLTETYVSMFIDTKLNQYLKLSFPHKNSWYNSENKSLALSSFLCDIELFPLVIASMVKVCKKKDPFKPEYIIPQLAMQWILERRNDSTIENTKKYIGISYTSVYMNDIPGLEPSIYANIAIPAIKGNNEIYSEELNAMFVLTEPVLCQTGNTYEQHDIHKIVDLFQLDKELADEHKHPRKNLSTNN